MQNKKRERNDRKFFFHIKKKTKKKRKMPEEVATFPFNGVVPHPTGILPQAIQDWINGMLIPHVVVRPTGILGHRYGFGMCKAHLPATADSLKQVLWAYHGIKDTVSYYHVSIKEHEFFFMITLYTQDPL